MTESRTHHRACRSGKKRTVPLSKLRNSDVVRLVLDNPRRLDELAGMLEDKDRCVRDRAAAMLGQVADRHPGRMLRILVRLEESLEDDSAYVRWHLVHILGNLGCRFPGRAGDLIEGLAARLEDPNRVVRVTGVRALARIAAGQHGVVEEFFARQKQEIPSAVARCIHGARSGRARKG